MATEKDKFHGGVRYYHRHTTPGEVKDPAMLDWDERKKLMKKRHRQRVMKALVVLLVVMGLVAATYFLMVP